MLKFTQKQIKEWLNFKEVVDMTNMSEEEIRKILRKEENFNNYAYSEGKYGCNGCIIQGKKTLTFYVMTKRTDNLFMIL